MTVQDQVALASRLLEEYRAQGYSVVRGLWTAEEVAELRETFMAAAKDGPVPGLSETCHHKGGEYSRDDPLAFYPRMMMPHVHPELPVGPLAMKYMLDDRVRRVLRELFEEEPWAVQSMFYFKPPGARGQDLHQDNFYLRVKPGTCLAAWTAVDDADEENGGMVCVPGTHDMPIVCPERSDSSKFFTTEHVEPPPGTTPQTVALKAGDVLFFNGSVIHGSYPNRSKTRFRRSLICHYVPQSTREMSHWYKAISFDGQRQQITANNDGGPCGTAQPIASAPH